MTDVENDVGAHDEMSPEEVRIQMEAEAMIEAEEEERIRNRTFIEKLQYRCMPMYGCELMGHKFHITEIVCLFSFGASLFGCYMMMKGSEFNDGFLAMAVMFIGFISVCFVWGYVSIASLSETINTLQLVAGKGAQESEQYKKINDALEKQADVFGERVDQLGEEIGAITEAGNQIHELIGPLENMQLVMEKLNEEQIQLGDGEDAFVAEDTQTKIDDARENTKNEFKQVFRFIADNTGGTLRGDTQIKKIREEFSKRNIPWNEDCEKAVADDEIHKYELLTIVDKALQTRYYRIRLAPTERDQLHKTVKTKERQLKELAVQAKVDISGYRSVHMRQKAIEAGQEQKDEREEKEEKYGGIGSPSLTRPNSLAARGSGSTPTVNPPNSPSSTNMAIPSQRSPTAPSSPTGIQSLHVHGVENNNNNNNNNNKLADIGKFIGTPSLNTSPTPLSQYGAIQGSPYTPVPPPKKK